MPEPINSEAVTSIQELKTIANEPFERSRFSRSAKAMILVKSMQTMFTQAKEELKKGSKKQAYIFFMRCLTMYTIIRECDDFDQKYFEDMYGKIVQQAYISFEKLDADLREEFDRLNASQINTTEAKGELAVENSKNDLPSENAIEKPAENLPSCNGLKDAASVENRLYISSKELFDAKLSSMPVSMLILDIRSKDDFLRSRMKLEDVINVPENLLTPGITANKIEPFLAENFKPYFQRRGKYDQIVILDWFSVKMIPASKIFQMHTVLTKWDTSKKYKNPPLILEGGFEDWLNRYPHLTTNSDVKPPKKAEIDSRLSLEKIIYPSEIWEPDRKILEFSNAKGISKPTIDRSTKPPLSLEQKNEIADNSEDASQNDVRTDASDITSNNYVSSTVEKENSEPKKKELKMEERKEHFESDEEMKNLYCQGGRRSALTSTTNHYKKVNGRNDDEDTKPRSRTDKTDEESSHDSKAIFSDNENSMRMKRCNSTPNISKLEIPENEKPSVDRSTKPSNDDQLNYYTMGCKHNGVGRGFTGLENLGNTCYMNSIIQCLSNTNLLRRSFCSSISLPIRGKSKTQGKVAVELANIIRKLWHGDGNPVSCRVFKYNIGQFNDMFKGHEQQDSHEFLTILIDWLHEDLKQPPPMEVLDGADEMSGEKAWGEFKLKNNSIIRQIFYGQLKSTVSCARCGKQSITFEPFSNLSLPLPPEENDGCSLKNCLQLYTNPERVDKWQCPGCKDLRPATKKLDITQLPPVLVIHFKRFTSIGGCKKQRTYVDFPDKLDMMPFISNQEYRFSQYKLYAISNHSGSMESGHYTACCKNPVNERWYDYDDQNVYPRQGSLKSRDAYILFYQCESN